MRALAVVAVVAGCTVGGCASVSVPQSGAPRSAPAAPAAPPSAPAAPTSAPAAPSSTPSSPGIASPAPVLSSPPQQPVPISTPASVVVGPMCRASQLAADLEDIEEAGATTFGWVIIRDTSAHACQLRGPIGIVGVTAAGVPDTLPSTAEVAGGLLLSARAAPIPQSALPPASEHVAFLVPGSPEFTTVGPNAGSDCTATDNVVPAAFRLDIAGTGEVTVPNGQTGGTAWFSHLTVCQGDLDASETVTSLPN